MLQLHVSAVIELYIRIYLIRKSVEMKTWACYAAFMGEKELNICRLIHLPTLISKSSTRVFFSSI